MKIAIIGPTYPYRGGISHYTTSLSNALIKANHATLLISFCYQYPQWLFPGQTDQDHSSAYLQTQNVEHMLHPLKPWTWKKTWLRIIQFQPDLIVFAWWHWYWTMPFYWILSSIRKRQSTPIVSICHNAWPHENAWFSRWCTQWVLRQTTHIVVHSVEEKKRLETLDIKIPIKVQFHPITLLSDQKISMTRLEARTKLNIDIKKNVMLFFGFVRPYKGLDILLTALSKTIHKIKVHLLVVGEFWKDKKKYLQQIEKLGLQNYITIVDRYIPNEEVSIYFNTSDLVVMPYRSVTGSGILPLAVIHEKPVIASKVGSLSELIEDGKTGFLVQPEDSDDLAEKILKFFEQKEMQDYQKQILELKKKLDWSYFINGMLDFVNKSDAMSRHFE